MKPPLDIPETETELGSTLYGPSVVDANGDAEAIEAMAVAETKMLTIF